MNKNQESLPKGVAKECFLFEAINYLMFGIAPIEADDQPFDTHDQDYRNSRDTYYDEHENFPSNFDDEELLSEVFRIKYDIKNPFFERRFREVMWYSSEDFSNKILAEIREFNRKDMSHRKKNLLLSI